MNTPIKEFLLLLQIVLLAGFNLAHAAPYSTADVPRILDSMRNSQYEELNELFSLYTQQYQADFRKEVTLHNAFRTFLTPEPWLEEKLTGWSKKYPSVTS